MYHAAVKNRLSKVDQENLALKLEKWKEQYPLDRFFYRPYGRLISMEHQNHGISDNDNHLDNEDEDNEVCIFSVLTLIYG